MSSDWTVAEHFDREHLTRIALAIGRIGTRTVSPGGRGDLRDWGIMKRPARRHVPAATGRGRCPFIVMSFDGMNGRVTRLLEGPVEDREFAGKTGRAVSNHGLPRSRRCSFGASYPLGNVSLDDPSVPLSPAVEAFDPLTPTDAERSGLPAAILLISFTKTSSDAMDVSVCMSTPTVSGSRMTEGGM